MGSSASRKFSRPRQKGNFPNLLGKAAPVGARSTPPSRFSGSAPPFQKDVVEAGSGSAGPASSFVAEPVGAVNGLARHHLGELAPVRFRQRFRFDADLIRRGP